ncbi:MAG: type II toxin-antitoxin system HicA family toxin [Bacteroidales bacterium]|nr:type II toxin-antitoxin system HicA family toxin [Bacteroidales bacterium]
MKTEELKRKLRRGGCYFVRQGSNHEVWFSPITNAIFTVPRHTDTKPNLVKVISKQSGVKI